MSERAASQPSAGWVPTDVWDAIAPEGVTIEPAERKLFRRTAIGVAAVLLLVCAGWWAGLTSPHLGTGSSSGGMADTVTRRVTYDAVVLNHGLVPATVTSAAVELPGATGVVTDPTPLKVGPGAHPLRLVLTVENCDRAVPSVRVMETGPRVTLGVSRPWGTARVPLDDDTGSGVRDLVFLACGIER